MGRRRLRARPAAGGTHFWAKAAIHTAEHVVRNGYGRDQPPLTLAAALALFV